MPRVRLLALLVLGLAARPGAAAECAGGSVRALRVTPNRVAFTGTVTRAGLTHPTAAAGGLEVVIEDARDGTRLYAVAIPADALVSGARTTTYDGTAGFGGSIRLNDLRGQADTVRVRLRDPNPTFLVPLEARPLRARLQIGGGCARTCVADCTRRDAGLRCQKSRLYEPFADAGFGALQGRRSELATSPWCGLTIDATRRCDFLIDERCVLPYPSSVFLDDDPTTPTGLRVHYDVDRAAGEQHRQARSTRPTGTRSTASARAR